MTTGSSTTPPAAGPPAPASREPRCRSREEFLTYTIEFWNRRSGKEIDREEALRIIENVTGLFRLLNDLERALNTDSKTGDQ